MVWRLSRNLDDDLSKLLIFQFAKDDWFDSSFCGFIEIDEQNMIIYIKLQVLVCQSFSKATELMVTPYPLYIHACL